MKVGAYDVVSMISKGAFGDVALGRAADGREVAIKLMRDRADAPELLERIQREQRLQTLFRASQGFVPIIDAGESAYGPYLVMPYLSGGSLRARLKERGRLGLEETLSLASALARAMATAHRLGVVHRDLKPENVLFDEEGRPFVCDLGLAKHFRRDLPGGSQSVPLSKTGELRGTFGYMAPEQIRDAKSAGPAADVFSLGVILHECLAGSMPYAIDSPVQLLEEIERGRPQVLSDAQGCPGWLAAILLRCLRPNPQQRFADGRALAKALEARDQTARPWRSWAALAVAGLLAIGLAAAAWGSGQHEPSAAPAVDSARAEALSAARGELSERRPRRALARLEGLTRDDALDGLRLDAYRALALDSLERGARRLAPLLEEASAQLPPGAVDRLHAEVGRHALARDDAAEVLDLLEARSPGCLRGPEFASFYLERARTALARKTPRQALLAVARAASADPTRAAWLPGLAAVYQTVLSRELTRGQPEAWLETALAGLRLGLTHGLFARGSGTRFQGGLLAHLEERVQSTPGDPELSLYLALALSRADLTASGRVEETSVRRALQLAEQVLADERLTLRARPIAHEARAEHLELLGQAEASLEACEAAIAAFHPRPDDCLLRMHVLAQDEPDRALDCARRFVAAREDRIAKTLAGDAALAEGRPPGQPLDAYPTQDEARERQRARHVLLDALLGARSPEAPRALAELVALRPSSLWAKGAEAKVLALDSADLSFFHLEGHAADLRATVRDMGRDLARVAAQLGRGPLKERLRALVGGGTN